MSTMGKVSINIPYVTWREGRPRFIPGANLRARGFKGEDLRHPSGIWFSAEEAIAWSKAFETRLKELPAVTPKRQRRAQGVYSIADLVEDWLKDPRLNGKELRVGKKVRRPLATNTVTGYRKSRNIIRDFDDGFLWAQPAAALSARALSGIIDRLEQNHGLAQARAIRAALSAAYSWGVQNHKVTANPVFALKGTLPSLPPRVRFGMPDEMTHLVAAADALGLPEIGDSIILGLWTGQRQNDRLSLTDGQQTADGILFRQSKKNAAPLLIPISPEVTRRIDAARRRRADWRLNYAHVVLDEARRRPFEASRYRKLFAKVREAAVDGLADPNGGWLIQPMPSLAGFRDQDLRDTAVTWLALAGNDQIKITSITGHSLASAQTILKHYLGLHPDMARTAIGNMVEWYDRQTKGEAHD